MPELRIQDHDEDDDLAVVERDELARFLATYEDARKAAGNNDNTSSDQAPESASHASADWTPPDHSQVVQETNDLYRQAAAEGWSSDRLSKELTELQAKHLPPPAGLDGPPSWASLSRAELVEQTNAAYDMPPGPERDKVFAELGIPTDGGLWK